VPEEYVLVRPVADPRALPYPPELVRVGSVAGRVPESDLRVQLWVTRLLLR